MFFIKRIENITKKWKIDRLLKNSKLPERIHKYLTINKSEIPFNSHGRSSNIRYVVFDSETTGLDLEAKILSIGGVEVIGNSILIENSFYEIIQYEYLSEKKKESIGIHGILPAESYSGRKLDSVIMDFLDYIQNSVLVAHHADFDIGLINKFLYQNYSFKLLNPVLDTAMIARKLASILNTHEYQIGVVNLNLDTLAEKFKIETLDRHNALGDSYITAELFLKLTAKMIRLGKSSLKQWF